MVSLAMMNLCLINIQLFTNQHILQANYIRQCQAVQILLLGIAKITPSPSYDRPLYYP